MTTLALGPFGGVRPRVSQRSGDSSSRAEKSENVKLWHGTLAPWREPKKILDCPDPVCCMRIIDCCVYTDPSKCASFAKAPSNCNRVFATGLKDYPYPVTAEAFECSSPKHAEPNWVRLGVPKPDPLSFTVPGLTAPMPVAPIPGVAGQQIKRECRDYIYTYVNKFGEEGCPSSPSADIGDADIDAVATLNIPAPPAGWCIEFVRVYRLFSGSDANYGEACYLFADEYPIDDEPIEVTEDTPPCDLHEPVQTECYNAPPECLEGIIELDYGGLAGFHGKDIYFTEPFEWHAWSCKMTLDDCIKGICELAGNIYVITDGRPYVISSLPNEKECRCCRSVTQHPEPMPLVSSRKSIAKTANGVIWPSTDGLVRMTGTSLSLITHSEFAEDDWQKFHPWNMTSAIWNGRFYGFSDIGGLFIDYTDGIYADGDVGANSRNTTSTYTPSAVDVDDKGNFYLAFGDGIYLWDQGEAYERYCWKSKTVTSASRVKWSAMRVYFEDIPCRKAVDPVTVIVWSGCKTVFTKKVQDDKPFRLPRKCGQTDTCIEIRGTSEVSNVLVSDSMSELIQG